MKDVNDLFKDEKESIVGYLTLNTGTLLITDGVWSDNLSVGVDEKITIDLGSDSIKVPIIAAKQSGQRFLLIPIDRGIPITETTPNNIVAMADTVELPKKEEEDE